jgi:hypothetical protein
MCCVSYHRTLSFLQKNKKWRIYPEMLIKLIYFSFLRKLHCFTFQKGEEPPQFRLELRQLNNISKNMTWYIRRWRHFAFLAYQVIGLNTVWLPFVGLCEVSCLYHHCQQTLLNWKGDYRCSGTCYQRLTGKGLGRNGISKWGLQYDLGLLPSVCRAHRELSEILYWSIHVPSIINANFNFYKVFKIFTALSQFPCILHTTAHISSSISISTAHPQRKRMTS